MTILAILVKLNMVIFEKLVRLEKQKTSKTGGKCYFLSLGGYGSFPKEFLF
jgi:hypothetical protein